MKTLLAFSTPQVPFYNGYEALDVKSPSVGDNRPLRLGKPTKPDQGKPSCNVKAASSKKGWVLVVDDSSLQGTECWAEPLLREAGSGVKGVTRKLPNLVQLTDHKSLLLVHIGRDESATLWVKGHQKWPGTMAERIESIRSSSSLPPVLGDNQRIFSLNTYLCGWCCYQNFVFDNKMAEFVDTRWGSPFPEGGEGSFRTS